METDSLPQLSLLGTRGEANSSDPEREQMKEGEDLALQSPLVLHILKGSSKTTANGFCPFGRTHNI